MAARTNVIRDARSLPAVVAASCVGSVLLGFACGGTTGREGLSLGDVDASVANDAGVDLDSGAFDVPILYADRELPDIGVPPEAGSATEAGFPWPDCPPFIPVDSNGNPIDLGDSVDEIPAAYDDAGQIVPAPDGSPCAAYPWLGTTAVDRCVTSTINAPYVALPPCNWCVDAGPAAAGLRQGQSRYDICLDLYACVVDSGCTAAECLCGSNQTTCSTVASGPCAAQELAALEYSATSAEVLKNFTNTANAAGFLGFCGGNLNNVLQTAVANDCFEAGAGP